MATYTNMKGTDNNDILTYDEAASSSTVYHAGRGNDTIVVSGGKVTVYTDAGNNNLLVTGGAGHVLQVGATVAEGDKINGRDILTISNANQVDAILGSGSDDIVIYKSNGKKSTGALSQIRGGLWGDTFTTNAGTENYQLYGDAGNDLFYINDGSNLVCWGGAANDTFNVGGGTGIKLRGGDSADIYNIFGNANAVDMQLGYGNDVVKVTAGDKHTIKANLGINTINLEGGSNHIITSDIDQAASKKVGKEVGYGVDKVYVNGAQEVKMNLGDGKDYVELANTTGTEVKTEGWGDSVVVEAGTVKCSIDTGAGDDEVIIKDGKQNDYLLREGNDVITVTGGENNSVYAGEGNDTLYLQGSRYSFYSAGAGDDLIIVDGMKGGGVQSNGVWMDSGNDTLIIKDASYLKTSATSGNKKVRLDKGDNLELGLSSGDDIVYITGGDSNVEINTSDGSDRIYIDKFAGSATLQLDSSTAEKDCLWINWDNFYGRLSIEDPLGDRKIDASKLDKIMLTGVKLTAKSIFCEYDEQENTLSINGPGRKVEILFSGHPYVGEIGVQDLSAYVGNSCTSIKVEKLMADFVWNKNTLADYIYADNVLVDDAFKFGTVANVPNLFVTGS